MPKGKLESKNKEFPFTIESTEENYLSFLSAIIRKHGYDKYTPVMKEKCFGIKVGLGGKTAYAAMLGILTVLILYFILRKKDCIDINNIMEYTNLVKKVLDEQPVKLTVLVSLEDIKDAHKKPAANEDLSSNNGGSDDESDEDGKGAIDHELGHFWGILEKKYVNAGDSGYTFISNDGDKMPLMPAMMSNPSKLPAFLKYAEDNLGVKNASAYEFALDRKGYGPDILSFVDNKEIVACEISAGDAICLKCGAEKCFTMVVCTPFLGPNLLMGTITTLMSMTGGISTPSHSSKRGSLMFLSHFWSTNNGGEGDSSSHDTVKCNVVAGLIKDRKQLIHPVLTKKSFNGRKGLFNWVQICFIFNKLTDGFRVMYVAIVKDKDALRTRIRRDRSRNYVMSDNSVKGKDWQDRKALSMDKAPPLDTTSSF
ncbi:hypothetical protein BJV78DRAFT_1158810 [Lactifluus subvellereus]|nr:hypothetical protein BJV78DRAFT_1158810 [Lactifluus subvellereus]